jgi:hypothetical protein
MVDGSVPVVGKLSQPPAPLGFWMGGAGRPDFLIDSKKRGLFNWLSKVHPAICLGLAFWAMISVKKYNAHAFLHGWLYCSLPIAVCIFCITLRLGSSPIFAAGGRFSAWIARARVACYPIYLFQEFERNFYISPPWQLSLVLSLLFGYLVHVYIEKKFYPFPEYSVRRFLK